MISATCISLQIFVSVRLVYFASGSQRNICNKQNGKNCVTRLGTVLVRKVRKFRGYYDNFRGFFEIQFH